MKRDLDRIREILLEIEQSSLSDDLHYDGDDDCYQLKLLREAGFVDCDVYEGEEWSVEVRQLTMKGHDFLDTIRDKGVWAQVKRAAEKARSYTFPLLFPIAESIAKQKLGL